MNNELETILNTDADGLLSYEYIVNHIGHCDEALLVDNIIRADKNGKITVSVALYLHAEDAERYSDLVERLIASSLEKDREHKYIVDLLPGIWGADYKERAEELSLGSDNFRRIYKRIYTPGVI